MRPERVPRPIRASRTRSAVVEAAARASARVGFAGARVEEIAAEAGMTTGAIYR
jgi:TetR/AcrR family acrAB operon transcriptional repressor